MNIKDYINKIISRFKLTSNFGSSGYSSKTIRTFKIFGIQYRNLDKAESGRFIARIRIDANSHR
jgi:hypothetical protein